MKKSYWSINSNIEPGDIILTRSSGLRGWAISKATGGEFSHAMITVDNVSCIEAVPAGVQRLSHQRLNFSSLDNVRVYRLIQDMPLREDILNIAVTKAARMASLPYDYLGAVALVFPNKRRTQTKAMFCSHLIALCFESTDAQLVLDKLPHQTSPNDFLESPFLEDVTEECFTCVELTQDTPILMDSPGFSRPVDSSTLLFRKFLKRARPLLEAHGITSVHTFSELVGVLIVSKFPNRTYEDLDRELFKLLEKYDFFSEQLSGCERVYTDDPIGHLKAEFKKLSMTRKGLLELRDYHLTQLGYRKEMINVYKKERAIAELQLKSRGGFFFARYRDFYEECLANEKLLIRDYSNANQYIDSMLE